MNYRQDHLRGRYACKIYASETGSLCANGLEHRAFQVLAVDLPEARNMAIDAAYAMGLERVTVTECSEVIK